MTYIYRITTRRMIIRDSMEAGLLAGSLIPAVVQEVLDEAVAVVVSSSDDFLLRPSR